MKRHIGKWRQMYVLIAALSFISAFLVGLHGWRNELALQKSKVNEIRAGIQNTKPVIFSKIESYDFASVVIVCDTLLLNPEISAVRVFLKSTGGQSIEICPQKNKDGPVGINGNTLVSTEAIGESRAEIHVSMIEPSLLSMVGNILQSALLSFVLVFASLSGFSFLFARRFIFPQLNEVLQAIHLTITTGQMVKTRPATDSFLGQLTQNFNKMQEAIEKERIEKQGVEKALRSSEQRLRTTLDSIGDAVIATNNAGEIILMNPVAEHLTGHNYMMVVDQPLENILKIRDYQEDPPKPAWIKRKLLITADKREKLVSMQDTPILTPDNETLGRVIVLRDITEEEELQVRLHQSEKMQAIGQLTSGISHDFNNILASISSAAEVVDLRMGGGLDEQSEQCLELIAHSVTRASELIDKLMTFARKKDTELDEILMTPIIHDTVQILEQTIDRSIEISYENRLEDEHIIGNEAALQTALLNLCLNASHAMPNGGKLILTTENHSFTHTDIQGLALEFAPGDYVALTVQDTGKGIDNKHIHRIFDPFFTTRADSGGTGLGLAMVYGTMQTHRGGISLQSELGHGARFTLFIPAGGQAEQKKPERKVVRSGKGLKVLLVDDEDGLRMTVGLMLKELGYQVLSASSGQQAINLYRKQKEDVALVILDLNMPKMNGAETASELWKINNECKIIIATGYAAKEAIAKCNTEKLSGILKKPFRIDKLDKLIHEVILNS